MTLRASILADGAFAFYPFDDAFGSMTAVDAAGANDLGPEPGFGGPPTFGAPGPIPGETVALFDGVDDSMQSIADVALPSSWSAEYFSRIAPGPADGRTVFHIGAGVGDYRPLVNQPRDGAGATRSVVFGQNAGAPAVGPLVLPEDAWNHVAITWTETAPTVGDLRIYANGVLVHTEAALVIDPALDRLTVGEIRGFGGDLFEGRLGYLALYALVLSPAQVAGHAADFLADQAGPPPAGDPGALTPDDARASTEAKYKTIYPSDRFPARVRRTR